MDVRGRLCHRGRLAAALLATAAVLVASACGGSDDDESDGVASLPAATAPATTAATQEDARDLLVAFTRCLREEGLDVPDPDFSLSPEEAREQFRDSGIDFEDPAVQEAVAACRPLLAGILQAFSPEQIEAFRDAAVEWADCMRDRGIDVPDPDFTAPLGRIFGELDEDDPDFRAANEACDDVFEDLGNPFEGEG